MLFLDYFGRQPFNFSALIVTALEASPSALEIYFVVIAAAPGQRQTGRLVLIVTVLVVLAVTAKVKSSPATVLG